MSPHGTTRHIDQLGRIVIPVELRRSLRIREGDLLEIRAEKDALIVRKVEPECALCGGSTDLVSVRERYVCAECMQEIRLEPACAICGRLDAELVEFHTSRVSRDCVHDISLV